MLRVRTGNHSRRGTTAIESPANETWRETFFRLVPAFDSLRTYSLRSLAFDTTAGVTVATVAVPQAMAYALAAGLPAHYGLYTAIVMTAVGALFDSSKQLINGPTNAISIAVLSALIAFPPSDRESLAILLALLVGAVQILITLLRLGDLNRYISHAVIVGFTLGAAVLIVLDQFKNLLGLPRTESEDGHFIVRFWHTITHVDQTHFATLAIGLGTILIALMIGYANRRLRFPIPALLTAVASMAFIVWAAGLNVRGVAVVGSIPAKLPSFAPPKLDWNNVRALAGSGMAIALLGLLEAIAMAKAIAAQTGQRLDVNQQCLSEGLANFVGSFFHCYPGSGSLTRSTINQQAGGQTQWSGVICAAAVALTVLLFGPLASYIPRSALAGILMLAAWRLVDRKQLAYHLHTTRSDAWIVVLTAISAVAISVEFCILIGVFLSFLFYVPRAARIHMTELVLAPERVVRERISSDPVCGRIRIFSLEGEFFFGAAPELEDHFDKIASLAKEEIRVVVLRVKRARNPDPVCLAVLERFIDRMDKLGTSVLLCGVRPDFMRIIEASGLVGRLGPEKVFVFQETGAIWSSTLEAIRVAYELLKGDVCAICPHYAESLEGKEGWYYMI
jgi:sulfate permease, SulP family